MCRHDVDDDDEQEVGTLRENGGDFHFISIPFLRHCLPFHVV